MCSGEGCPIKEKCHRFTSQPNLQYQSYFVGIPGLMLDEQLPDGTIQKKFSCTMFWGDETQSIYNQLEWIFGEPLK